MPESLGIFCAFLSAITQACAHAILAGGRDKLVIRGLIGATGLCVVLPLTLLVPLPTGELWWWLLASGALHAVYQLTLIKAYAGEDFSVAYPLARGVSPVVLSLLGFVLLGDRLTPPALVGVVMVSAGLLWVAATRRPAYAGMVAALLAGGLTTAYTLLDAHAVRLSPSAWTFIVWFFVFDGLIMTIITVGVRRGTLPQRLGENLKAGLFAGFASLLTYSTALLALRLIPAASTAAIRETSIVFGAIIAVVFLNEKLKGRRLTGTLLIAAGGILVAVWGSR